MAQVSRRHLPRLLVLAAVALLVALAFTAEALAGGSSTPPIWTRHWTPPSGDRFDGGYLARAATGDLYVGGEITRAPSNQTDWLVARYTSAGQRKWVHAFAGPFGNDTFKAIAADAKGNVIAVGDVSTAAHGGDWMVVKWSRAGRRLWKRQIDGTAHGFDSANDVVVATDGSIYVTGGVVRTGTSGDGLTVRYSAGGHVIWSRYVDGAEHSGDRLLAIARDAKNRVYVTGWDYALSRADDCVLVRYSPSGHRDWLRRWGDDVTLKHDIGSDVAVRGSYVAVAGTTIGDPVGWHTSGLALKYSTAGVLKWARSYANDVPTRDADWSFVDIDGKGRVAVGGYAQVSATPGDGAWATTVYFSNGNPAPVQKLQGEVAGGSRILALRMTAAGRVYETGYLGYTASSLDLYVIALRYTGAPLWGSIVKTAAYAPDLGYGIVPTSKAVYVGGKMYKDLVLLKYKPTPTP
jgi:hypothetical protein